MVLFVCLFVCLSVCSSVCLSVRLSVCLFICLSVCLPAVVCWMYLFCLLCAASVQAFDQTAREAQNIRVKIFDFEDYVR